MCWIRSINSDGPYKALCVFMLLVKTPTSFETKSLTSLNSSLNSMLNKESAFCSFISTTFPIMLFSYFPLVFSLNSTLAVTTCLAELVGPKIRTSSPFTFSIFSFHV